MARDTPMTPAQKRAVAKVIRANRRTSNAKDVKRRLDSGEKLTRGQRVAITQAGVGSGAGIIPKAFKNIVESAIYTPAGMHEIGKAVVGDVREAQKSIATRGKKGDVDFDRSRKVGKAVVDSTVETVKHPLRRPGDTLLLGVGAITAGAGLASRASAAGSAARAAGKAGKSRTKAAVARPGHEGGSLLRRPAPEPRYLRMGDAEVRSRYSSSPAIRGAQKAYDKATDRKGGLTEAGAVKRVSREIGQNRKVSDAAETSVPKALKQAGRKLTGPQQMALRVWAEGSPADAKIARHKAEYAKAKGVKRHQLGQKIGALEASKLYLKEVEDVPGDRRSGDGPTLIPARTLKQGKGRPGITREDGWDAREKRADPDNPIYVYRDDNGNPLGHLQVTLKDGKPDGHSVVVRPDQRRKGIATKLYEAAGRDYDISRSIGRSGLTDDGAGLVNAFVTGRSRVAIADDFQTPRNKKRIGRRGATPAELKRLTHAIDRVAGDSPGGRERVLLDMGLLEPDQIEFRKQAPGRMDMGATFQSSAKVTAARLKELDKSRDELLKSRTDVEVPGGKTVTSRPRTREETEARLKAFDEAVEPLIASITADIRAAKKGHGPGAAVEKYEHWINLYGKKEGSRIAALPEEDRKLEGFVQGNQGRYRAKREDLSRDWAEEMISQAVGRESSRKIGADDVLAVHQVLKEQGVNLEVLRRSLDERDNLRAVLADAQPSIDEVFGEAPRKEPDYGIVRETVETPPTTIPGRLSDEDAGQLAALDDLRELLEREGLVGADDFTGGRVRIPDAPNIRQRAKFKAQQYRGGTPRKPSSVTQPYTGALRESGGYRNSTTDVVAESGLEAQRYASVGRLRDKVLKAARDERPADTRRLQWVPVREKSSLSPKLRRKLADIGEPVEGRPPMTLEEKRVAQAAWQEFVDDIFPKDEFRTVGVGETIKGVKWIPKQALDGVNRPLATGVWAASLGVLDTTLNLVKFGIIPLKPAYIAAHAAGNVTFNLAQQGLLMPVNWARAVQLLKHEELGPAMREVMGSGSTHALLEGNPRGLLAGAMTKTSDLMAEAMFEPMMRLSALIHEGRRFGVKTDADWHDLMFNPARADDLAEIGRRGKAAIIDYDNLGPIERGVVRRGVFIYPWVKGATVYGGHFLMEHPVQAATYNQVGNVGREASDRDLGAKPSWARGLFKVGGTDDMPLTVNPSGISPFSQAAQIGYTALGALTGEGGSAEQVGGMLHPAIRASLEAAFKRDLSTGAGKEGSFAGIVKDSLLDDVAPSVYAANLERSDDASTTRTYPMTRKQSHLRFVLGSFAPRTTNREVLNARADEELERKLSPAVRARRDVARERQALFVKMKREDPEVLEDGRLPKGIRQAYEREAAVKAARAEAKREFDSGEPYHRAALIAEARLAERWGAVDKGFARQAEEWAQTRSEEELEKARERLRYQALRPAYGDVTTRARKYLDG